MVDKNSIMQVLCGLMKKPQYLSETDKYYLTTDDFSSLFEKYIFAAINNLYTNGAQVITPLDIENYFSTHTAAKQIFEQNNGIEYLQNLLEISQEENFPFYYNRLKKFNCLRDLNKMGYDTSNLYCEDLLDDKAKKINDKFEELSVNDIFSTIKKDILKLESDYNSGDASQTQEAAENVEQLIKELKERPEVGAPLQGDIYNTICRGARRTKFYIRTSGSGVGKTRRAVGDACYLSYPIRFDTTRWDWVLSGSCEKTLIVTTEQEPSEIQTLILAYLTGFNEEKFLYGKYNEEEEKVVKQAIEVMNYYRDNVYIVQLSNPSISQIKAVIRQNWILHDIKNVFYDYIFSSPSLLNEFRDLKIREDVALGLLSTALKDLAVEMDLFVMSATQTNAKAEEGNQSKGIKNELVIRGSRAIIDKCDVGMVTSRITEEDKELISDLTESTGLIPNQVTDIFKVRRGKYTNVKIWQSCDLGTCRVTDLFITDANGIPIEEFKKVNFYFMGEKNGALELTKKFNEEYTEQEPIKEKKGGFVI